MQIFLKNLHNASISRQEIYTVQHLTVTEEIIFPHLRHNTKRGKEKKMAKCMTTDFEIWSDHGGNVHGSGTTYFKVPTAGL